MNLDTTHNLLLTLGTLLAGGIGVHLVANLLKRLFGLKSSSVIHTMVLALAAVASGMQYFWQLHSNLPPVVLGISTTTVYGFSQIIYRYAGYASDFLGKVNAYQASVAPASQAPVSMPPVPAEVVAEAPASTPAASF